MSTYLDLCNKVIQESANELDELTVDSWSDPEAGRRLYPRIKRMVAESWVAMQLERDEWEFKAKELNTTVYPRIKLNAGSRAGSNIGPGVRFKGQTSGFEFTVKQYIGDNDWTLGGAKGQLEMEDTDGGYIIPGETFEEIEPSPGDGIFVYEQKGSYDFSEVDPLFRTLSTETMVTYRFGESPSPCLYVPWNNWTYKELDYTRGSATTPVYFSVDFEGNTVFYPQTLDPFNVSVVYDTAPQELSEPEDEPLLLDPEFHPWIAWKALENIAQYDKNPTLFAYANKWTTFYKQRADKKMLPTLRWGSSSYRTML